MQPTKTKESIGGLQGDSMSGQSTAVIVSRFFSDESYDHRK